jgi:hypothetical protein
LVMESQGHPLNFVISRRPHHGQRYILEAIDGLRSGQRKRKPKRFGLDKGYDSEPLRTCSKSFSLKPQQSDIIQGIPVILHTLYAQKVPE